MSTDESQTQTEGSEGLQENISQPSEPAGSEGEGGEGNGTSPLETTGFKWGDDAPQEWKGKTAQEAASQYEGLKNAVRQYFSQQQQAQQVQGGQPAQPAQPQHTSPEAQMSQIEERDPELWFSNPAQAEAQLEKRIAGMMQQYAAQSTAPLAHSAAESAKHLSRTDPELKEVWDKYGTEIETMVGNVDTTHRSNKAVWDQAARIAKGNHADELIQEKAKEIAVGLGSGVEGGSGVGGSAGGRGSSKFEKLRESSYGSELIEKYGEDGVLSNVEKMGMSLDEFTEMAANTEIHRDPDKPGEWKNFNIARGS